MIIIKIEFNPIDCLKVKRNGWQTFIPVNGCNVPVIHNAITGWLGTVTFDSLKDATGMIEWLLGEGYNIQLKEI